VHTKNFGDLDELVLVVGAAEEWLLVEEDTGEHASEGPHVERVIVHLVAHQELGTLVVPRRHSHVVLHVCERKRERMAHKQDVGEKY
jgi:hypothetical protein